MFGDRLQRPVKRAMQYDNALFNLQQHLQLNDDLFNYFVYAVDIERDDNEQDDNYNSTYFELDDLPRYNICYNIVDNFDRAADSDTNSVAYSVPDS